MEIVFSKQTHQQNAINNIIEILSPCMDKGVVNVAGLESSIKEFYKSENGLKIPVKNISKHNNIDILMETGTGKTYTYLEMIFELNKRFGSEKFIIFLPRTSILESVKQNISLSAKHFSSIYGKQIAVYEKSTNKSKKTSSIISNGYFNNKGEISVLLLMAQSIKSKKNLLNKSSERYIELFDNGEQSSILANIAKLNPICILDEPHLLSGDAFLNKFIRSKNEEAEFRNCLLVRFGATFKKASVDKKGKKKDDVLELSNVAYVLDSKMAFKEYLVKQITVSSQENTKKAQSSGIKNDLDINRNKRDKNAISIMLQTAINRHFEKEERLFNKGIKALSLFFIENIADYKGDDPFVKNEFERLYKIKRNEILASNISKEYKEYLERDFSENGELKVHGGYFSGDAKTTDESEKIAVDMILKDKISLLSLKEPLRFLFSVWALQEGWDNPNIFTLTKLGKTSSEISARQQVGRGLRLCVNNKGTRITKEFIGDENEFYEINALDVVVGADENNFIDKLQKEINESSYNLEVGVNIKNDDLCQRLDITERQARKLLCVLDDFGVLDENDNITKPLDELLENAEFSKRIDEVLGCGGASRFRTAFISSSVNTHKQIKSANDDESIKIKKSLAMEFKELWQSINKHANMRYKDIDEIKLIDESVEEFKQNLENHKSISIVKRIYDAKDDEVRITSKDSIESTKNDVLIKEQIKGQILEFSKNQNLALPAMFCAKLIAKILKDIKEAGVIGALNRSDLREKVSKLINKHLLASVSYEFGGEYSFSNADLLYDNKGEPKESVKKSALGKYESDKEPAKKYMYEKIIYDSNIENEVSMIDENLGKDEIKVFAKLPNFKIPTPVGEYKPDFAYVIKKGSGEQIFFVCETKGYDDEMDFEKSAGEGEKIKIDCARKFFKALNDELKGKVKVIYEKRLNKQNLSDILKRTLRE